MSGTAVAVEQRDVYCDAIRSIQTRLAQQLLPAQAKAAGGRGGFESEVKLLGTAELLVD
jgi:hypothetical protein